MRFWVITDDHGPLFATFQAAIPALYALQKVKVSKNCNLIDQPFACARNLLSEPFRLRTQPESEHSCGFPRNADRNAGKD